MLVPVAAPLPVHRYYFTCLDNPFIYSTFFHKYAHIFVWSIFF